MRSVEEWLDSYGESHQNPTNKKIHWVCVPVILITLIGALWDIKLPLGQEWLIQGDQVLNGGVSLILFALIYYAFLSVSLMIGMLLVSSLSIMAVIGLKSVAPMIGLNLLQLSLLIFGIAWVGQFVGHKIEGKKPSFFEDIQFLLIGPLWLLSFIYRRLGISY